MADWSFVLERVSSEASFLIGRLSETLQDFVAESRKVLPPRRERIATAALQGLLSRYYWDHNSKEPVKLAVQYADALIDELRK